MLNLPALPQTRIARQLTCVCCNHVFTIAEDDALRDPPRTPKWQFPPDNHHDAQLRYQPDRSRRLVMTEARAGANIDPDDFQNWDDERRDQINCPRCGADNRNWMHIVNPSTSHHVKQLRDWRKANSATLFWPILAAGLAFFMLALLFAYNFEPHPVQWALMAAGVLTLLALIPILFLPASFMVRLQQWQQRFGMATAGLLITAVLVIMAAYFHYDSEAEKVGPHITLLVVIALAGIVPTITMLGAWPRLRIYKAQRAVMPAKSFPDFSPPLRSWFAYTALFLFILPTFLYVAVPSAFHIFSTFIKPEEEPAPTTLAERVNNVRTGLEDILVQAPPGSAEMVEEAIADLLVFMEDVPLPIDALNNLTLDQKADIVLTWTHDLAKNAPEDARPPVEDAIADLEKFIETTGIAVAVPAAETAPTAEAKTNDEEDDLPPWISADKKFLNVWFKYVLASSIAALVFSLVAVNGFVRRIGFQLPRPIFHSLANMTRVVVWEAGASLEIGDEVHLIQWTGIRRNEKGGIDLVGLYRDAVPAYQADDSPTARVRAQRYEISSDMWGRVESANVTAMRVPVRPRLPRLRDDREIENIESDFFRTAVQTRDTQP